MNLSVQTWMTMVTLLQKTGKTEKASDRIDERMKKYHANGHKVFVIWEKQKVKSKSKKHVINVGTILKRYKDGANYDVNCDEPVSYNEKIKSWGFSWKPKKRQIKSKESSSKATTFIRCINIRRSVSTLIWSRLWCPLRKIPWFYLILWCRNFVERLSFRRVSGDSKETVPFRKIPTPGNKVKLRYFTQWSFMIHPVMDIVIALVTY